MKELRLIEVASQGALEAPAPRAVRQGQKAVKAPSPGTLVHIAVDISSTKWAYAVRWEGQQRWRQTGPAEISHLLRLIAQYSQCRIRLVYEACGFGYEIAWQLRERGVEVVVVAPTRMERAPGLRVKSDRIDASKLALDLEKGNLKGIWVPSREVHEQRAPLRAYRQAMRDRGRAAARIRLLMQEHGRCGPRPGEGWSSYARWLAAQEMPASLQLCADQHLAQRKCADQMVRRLHKEVIAIGRSAQYAAVVKALRAQAGVGEFAATVFVLEMGDLPARFATAGSIANYLGLTPSQYASGETDRRGHILKCGPGSMRALLVQCAWTAVNRGTDRRLVEAYHRLAPRTGKKRAIIAVARRLALRLRARWLEALKKAGEDTPVSPS